MLTMRRHEKDFMLRRDRKYGDDMKKRTAEFFAGLEAAEYSGRPQRPRSSRSLPTISAISRPGWSRR